MEEEVSNYIQDRHKFVVDILLTVVLLEEELETLTQKIEEFERKRAEQKSKAEVRTSARHISGTSLLTFSIFCACCSLGSCPARWR
jgi:hypothetical protein